MILGVSTGIFSPFFQFIIVALTLWTGCRGWKPHWEDSQHCLYDFKPERLAAGGTYFASRRSSRGQGAGDEVPGVFRNKDRGVEGTWTEERERDPSPAAHGPRTGDCSPPGRSWMPAGWVRGTSPGIDPFRPASPACTAPPGPADLPTRSKDSGETGETRTTAGRALSGRPPGFRPRPFPLSATPAPAPGLRGPSFLLFSPFPPVQSPLCSLPFCHLHCCPAPPITKTPRPASTTTTTTFTTTVTPRTGQLCPKKRAVQEGSPRKSSGAQSREAAFVEIKPDVWASRLPRSRPRLPRPWERAGERPRLGKGKQDPGEGVTMGGDTGDGYRAGSPPSSDSGRHPWSVYLPTPEFQSGAPTPHLAIFHVYFPSVSRSSFRRPK